jgi:hypothetical protein
MEQQAKVLIELFNYGLALSGLLLFGLAQWLTGRRRKARFARELGL